MSIKDQAEELEQLLPILMRTLHKPDPDDPLTELTMPQIRIMRLINFEPRTASSLGEELGLSVSAVTQMANRMEAAGLLERHDNKGDKRVKPLCVTEYGRELMQRRHNRRVSQAEESLAILSDEERLNFLAALSHFVSACKSVSHKKDELGLPVLAEMEQRLPNPPHYTHAS